MYEIRDWTGKCEHIKNIVQTFQNTKEEELECNFQQKIVINIGQGRSSSTYEKENSMNITIDNETWRTLLA